MKTDLREKDCQWNARESTAGPGIKDFGTGYEINHFSNAQGMKNMPFIKVVNVFPGNDINLCIPFPVKRPELFKLFNLSFSKRGEIFFNYARFQIPGLWFRFFAKLCINLAKLCSKVEKL